MRLNDQCLGEVAAHLVTVTETVNIMRKNINGACMTG